MKTLREGILAANPNALLFAEAFDPALVGMMRVRHKLGRGEVDNQRETDL